MKRNQYKTVNYRIALLSVLLLLTFSMDTVFSLTEKTKSQVNEKLITQGKAKKERLAEAIELNKQGLQLSRQGNYKEALQLFEKALIIYREIGEKQPEGVTLNNLGLAYSYLGQYQKALDFYQQALAITQQLKDKFGESSTLNNIGGVYKNWGNYQKALDYYQQALLINQRINNQSGEATNLNNIAGIYDSLGKYQKALEAYQQSLAITKKIGNKDFEGATLNNIGSVYVNLGQRQKALEYYQLSLVISQKNGNKFAEGRIFNNIGFIYQNLGQFQQALNYYQKSLVISQQISDRAGEGGNFNNIGGVYNSLGQYENAISYYQKALVISQQIGDKSGASRTFNNIGEAYRNLKQYQKALDYYQKSLAISQPISDKLIEGTTLNNTGEAYRSLKQYQKALTYYEQALLISQKIGNKLGESRTFNNIAETYRDLKQYKKALDYYQKSLLISQQIGDKAGEGSTLNNIGLAYIILSQYSQAEKFLFDAVNIWDLLRMKLLDNQKISLFSKQVDTYKFLQLALIPQNKIEQALEISERGRARAFIDLLTSKSINNNHDIGKMPTITAIKEIAQKQKSTIVEYSVFGNDKLNIWVVKPTGKIAFEMVDLKSLNISLNTLVENSRLSIGVRGRGIKVIEPSEANNKDRFKKLHEVLIKPIAKHLPKNHNERVVFIPDQSLFLVPFPALIDENQKYLIEKHTIITAPAIQILEFTKKDNSNPLKFASLPQSQKLIVGNPIMPFIGIPPVQLSSLPGAEVETKLIASLLKTKPLIGQQAKKSTVMQLMNNAKLIHLATHGLLDGFGERTPGAIALSPDSKASQQEPNEGLLRTREIVENLKLQADLIVLSACDTGKGEISGDGVQGLSRAFLTAGAKSLIVSLWQVPDDATSYLMIEFYKQLEKNADKAYSLRQAMLKTMQEHPGVANWAAFTIIGNPE